MVMVEMVTDDGDGADGGGADGDTIIISWWS